MIIVMFNDDNIVRFSPDSPTRPRIKTKLVTAWTRLGNDVICTVNAKMSDVL